MGAIEHLSLAEMPSYQAIWLMNSHDDLARLEPKKKTQIFKAIGGHPWTIGMFARHASTKGADALLLELEPLKKELREFTLFDKSYSLLDAVSKELLIRASIFEEAVPVVALRWMMGDEAQPSPTVDQPLQKLMHWGLMARQDEREETLYPFMLWSGSLRVKKRRARKLTATSCSYGPPNTTRTRPRSARVCGIFCSPENITIGPGRGIGLLT
jgi:hypothetical protein